MIKEFDKLIEFGIKPLPLKPNSKVPLCKSWNEDWKLSFVRDKFLNNPRLNMGILLGDFIDIEGDNHWANDKIMSLIGDYDHPTYKSSKSIHHLFLNDLGVRLWKHNGIEFRGHGHQSVLPPSKLHNISYKWINFNLPIPTLPTSVRDYYKSKTGLVMGKRLPEGCRYARCYLCHQDEIIHKRRYEMEMQIFSKLWECHQCRKIDVREACRIIKKNNRLRRKYGNIIY